MIAKNKEFMQTGIEAFVKNTADVFNTLLGVVGKTTEGIRALMDAFGGADQTMNLLFAAGKVGGRIQRCTERVYKQIVSSKISLVQTVQINTLDTLRQKFTIIITAVTSIARHTSRRREREGERREA